MTFDMRKAGNDLDDWMTRDPRDSSTAFGAGIILTEHMQDALDLIDLQAGQIAALKAACIESEARGRMLQHNEWSQDIKDLSDFVEDAKKQLARVLPDIFGEGRDRCWKAESELARWRAIAINERARCKLYQSTDADLSSSELQEAWFASAAKYREQAAKELQLEAAKANCGKRKVCEECSYDIQLEELYAKVEKLEAAKELEEPKRYPPLFRLDEEFPSNPENLEPKDCCP
jgi:hypothetical protein